MRRSFHDAWWRLVSRPPRSPLAHLLKALLQVGSGLYGLGVGARERGYARGRIPTVRLACPVISVGNLTVGGTGKTPCVEALAAWLRGRGWRVAILSRGYGVKARDPAAVLVGRGGRVFANDAPIEDPAAWPDEPQLLASRLEDVPIVVGPRRVETGRVACERLGADILLMDDGFQHRELARDCDVVLLDAGMPLDGWALLPAGPMREPLRALRRADVIVLTKADRSPETVAAWRETLPRLNDRAVVATASHEPASAADARTGADVPLDRLAGRRVLAVSSIGDPASFDHTLATLGATVAGHATFPDHHRVSAADWRRVAHQAEAEKAAAIVTTEKDLVRLRPLLREPAAMPVWVLRIRMRWLTGEEALHARLAALCAR